MLTQVSAQHMLAETFKVSNYNPQFELWRKSNRLGLGWGWIILDNVINKVLSDQLIGGWEGIHVSIRWRKNIFSIGNWTSNLWRGKYFVLKEMLEVGILGLQAEWKELNIKWQVGTKLCMTLRVSWTLHFILRAKENLKLFVAFLSQVLCWCTNQSSRHLPTSLEPMVKDTKVYLVLECFHNFFCENFKRRSTVIWKMTIFPKFFMSHIFVISF